MPRMIIKERKTVSRVRLESFLDNLKGQFFGAKSATKKILGGRIWNPKTFRAGTNFRTDLNSLVVYDAGRTYGPRKLNLDNIEYINHGGVQYIVT